MSSSGRFLKIRGRYELRGVSDIICLPNNNPNGITIFVEVKRPSGRQSKEQKAFEAHLKKRSVPYYVVASVEEIKEVMAKYV